MADQGGEEEFPYSLTISIPLPTHRLAHAAFRSLKVDAELSPLVRRSFSLTSETHNQSRLAQGVAIKKPENSVDSNGIATTKTKVETDVRETVIGSQESLGNLTVLRTEYRATTNRMLRVAVNGFMESLGVVLGVMEELDVDVLADRE